MQLLIVSLLCCGAFAHNISPGGVPWVPLPEADGNLHIYALPVGQGDAQIIQCPNGDLTVYDWGSSNSVGSRFWAGPELTLFLGPHQHRIHTVVITHNHWDHYSFLTDTFHGGSGGHLLGLRDIYVSCQRQDFPARMQEWMVQNPSFESMIRLLNDGQPCGTKTSPNCGTIDICPGTCIHARILGANLGQQCTGGNRNMDSMVTKISWGGITGSIILGGDLNDRTTSLSEDGPQKWLIDRWGRELLSDVYQIAHHSSENLANKPDWRKAIQPRSVWATGDPWFTHRHPRCLILDGFVESEYLCEPLVPGNCGNHLFPGEPEARRLQPRFTCGDDQTIYDRPVNRHAIFTTVPTFNSINMVTYSNDGRGSWSVMGTIMDMATPDGHADDDELPFDYLPVH